MKRPQSYRARIEAQGRRLALAIGPSQLRQQNLALLRAFSNDPALRTAVELGAGTCIAALLRARDAARGAR